MRRIIVYGLPLLFAVLGVPLWLTLVPPNRFYGYRTPTAFAIEQNWYQINRWCGFSMMIAGAFGFLLAMLIEHYLSHWKAETRTLVSLLSDVICLAVALIAVAIRVEKI